MCQFQDCNKRKTYGIKGEKAKYCQTHKETNMIDLSRKLCEDLTCPIRATYNVEGQK
jgi:hypothetical protein